MLLIFLWSGLALALQNLRLLPSRAGTYGPVVLSPDGSQLFVVNTPDNTLEIFDVGVGGLTFSASVPVSMEPVAVAARTNDEVWVVNHLVGQHQHRRSFRGRTDRRTHVARWRRTSRHRVRAALVYRFVRPSTEHRTSS
jgi:YVTN family beta-propeller protein